MSGRTRVTLADGRRVTGYRKTLRQNPRRDTPRTPTDEAPLLRLIFRLPSPMMLTVSPGKATCRGAMLEVGPLANVSVELKTFNCNALIEAAAWFFNNYTPRGASDYTVCAVLTSSSDPHWSGKWHFAYVDGHVVATQSPTEPLIFPAAA